MLESQKAPARSFRAEREFGYLVGGMLILIGGWQMYRGNWKVAGPVLLATGSILALLGLVFPRALVIPNRLWMKLAMLLSLVTTPIILGLVYFLVFMPIGVVRRMTGWDPLRRRAPAAPSYWVPYNSRQQDSHHFEKMY
jgi:ABC-type Fe3+ transport system permease subunit